MKRSAGRPKTDKGQRSVRVTVTYHRDEYDAILKVARKPTTFIREASLNAARGK
jgi:preprotein translocase subunit Sss1